MALTLAEAKQKIDAILSSYAAVTSPTPASLLSSTLTAGKVYEAWVLGIILEGLRVNEGYEVELIASSKVVLKSAPGPINRNYAHFSLTKPGKASLEVWTDVEFVTLSHKMQMAGGTGPISSCHYHELDIIAVPAGTKGRPRNYEVLMGVECKHTSFQKQMARAALGVRRELSLLSPPQPTAFDMWPRSEVSANPPSVLMVLSTDPAVEAFSEAGQPFGVDFIHAEM